VLSVYKLTRREQAGYCEFYEKVIVAENMGRARELANEVHGLEGPIWTDTSKVTCRTVYLSTEGVIAETFCN